MVVDTYLTRVKLEIKAARTDYIGRVKRILSALTSLILFENKGLGSNFKDTSILLWTLSLRCF